MREYALRIVLESWPVELLMALMLHAVCHAWKRSREAARRQSKLELAARVVRARAASNDLARRRVQLWLARLERAR